MAEDSSINAEERQILPIVLPCITRQRKYSGILKIIPKAFATAPFFLIRATR